jgi:hypothetical protein
MEKIIFINKSQIYKFNNAMVLQKFKLIFVGLCGGKKQLFYFLERWLFLALGKNECAVGALAFLVQMFNFSTISALCTTFCSYKKLAISESKTVCQY